MPEITKSGANLHLFIVTHKYTDLYFIFSFNNQPQVGKPTWGYDYTTALRRLPHPSSAIIIGLRQRRNTPPSRKTAEERFNMLARGWLAYPVMPTHALLPPKSGCICQHIPRFALSRRRATALFRNPVRKAQRSVLGFSSTPTSACRRYATSPPSAVASPIVHHHHQIAHPHRPPSIYMRFGDALLRRPRKRSRLQLTPDRVGGTRTDAYAPRSAAAERSIAKCRKLGRR